MSTCGSLLEEVPCSSRNLGDGSLRGVDVAGTSGPRFGGWDERGVCGERNCHVKHTCQLSPVSVCCMPICARPSGEYAGIPQHKGADQQKIVTIKSPPRRLFSLSLVR
jgi:hypothetical protein